MASNSQFPSMQPPRLPLAGPPQSAYTPMPVPPQFRPHMVPPQPFIPGPSQQFQPLGHTNVMMPPPPSQVPFPQPMQQMHGRSIAGAHNVPSPQAIPPPPDFANRPVTPVALQPQQNFQMSNNYMPCPNGSSLPVSSSFKMDSESSGSLHKAQKSNSMFPVGGQPCVLPGNPSNNSKNMPMEQSKEPLLKRGEESNTAILEANPRLGSADKMESSWIEHTARTGKKYYYNLRTKVSSWEKPLELMTAIEKADASTNWRECTSPDGNKYYYNKITKVSKWAIPDELKLVREMVKLEPIKVLEQENSGVSHTLDKTLLCSAKASPSAACLSALPQEAGASPISVAIVVTNELLSLSDNVSKSPTESVGMQTPSKTASPVVKSDGHGVSTTPADPITTQMVSEISSVHDAAADTDRGSPGKTQEVEKSAGVSEKGSVASSDEKLTEPSPLVYPSKLRKQAFNEYVEQKKTHEAEEKRARQKKGKEDFKIMLEECKELTSSTRWSKAIYIFENDERYKAVERPKDREDLFQDYIQELDKKERAKALEANKQNRIEYLEFLKSCDFIKASSQWRKVQDRIEADERCLCLEKIDRLEIFQEYIRDLEREEEEQRKLRMEELRKTERKNRDEFRKLMEEHVSEGALTARTHWRDYCVKVKDSLAYLAVSSNTSGSTAKDLFEDVVEELEKQFVDDKARIKHAIKVHEIALTTSWTFENLKAAISEDISSPPISDTNLKFVFEELLERAREKEEKEAKRLKRLADDFYELLSVSKEITASSRWEDCKPFLDDRKMSEEGFLRDIFDKFVAGLKEKAKEKERKRREEKARKEKGNERKGREKEKHRRDKDREDESRSRKKRGRKESTDSDDKTESYSYENNRRSESERGRKHREQQHSRSIDEGENEKRGQSRSTHQNNNRDHKKSKQESVEHHGWASETKPDGHHKKYMRDYRRSGGSHHRNGSDYVDGEDGEVR
ncbi:unnamed protein product [Cuscuta campestris]|uniref:Pre-mRNA-processing protein 40A n=1 Tax=Cuscuta campestris TaxID=132261 RepID=A0A484KPF9_9ASTE|nr:unnamed protein product [Cuscuta campestris]